ncbi:MAG: hypothetical protein OXG64_00145 [Chloroflexi bacterium]|nr:hypothetical protein [Chloroflexota bacterium]
MHDERALVRRPRDAHFGGAALAVSIAELLPADAALWSLPTESITPHIGARFHANRCAQIGQFLDQLKYTK